jgi:hypothetical protein
MLDSYVTWRKSHLASVPATFRHESVQGDTVDQQVEGSSQAHCGCGWKSASISTSVPEFWKILDQAREIHVRTAGDIDARAEFPWFGAVAPRYVAAPQSKSSGLWIIAVLIVFVALCAVLCVCSNIGSQVGGVR